MSNNGIVSAEEESLFSTKMDFKDYFIVEKS